MSMVQMLLRLDHAAEGAGAPVGSEGDAVGLGQILLKLPRHGLGLEPGFDIRLETCSW